MKSKVTAEWNFLKHQCKFHFNLEAILLQISITMFYRKSYPALVLRRMSCATLRGGLAWRSCVEVLRRGLAWTLKWSKVPEDSSDFDDFWTELIVMTWTFILAILQKNLQKYFRPFPGRRFFFRPFPDRRFFVRRFPDRRFFFVAVLRGGLAWACCAGLAVNF